MKRNTIILLIVGVAAVCLCGLGGLLWYNSRSAPAPAGPTPTPSAAAPAGGPQALTAQPWQWTSFTSPVEQFDVQDPQNYQVNFLPDGALAVKADCNTVSGSYTTENNQISISLGASTLVACPPGSRSDQFIKLLGGAALYFFQDGSLFIDMQADSGTLRFAPAPAAVITPPAVTDPVWEQIQAQNKLVVGISADYPPFSFIDTDYVIKGYDVALIQEIGRRLGLPLDINNMAFDGLIQAVQIGQVNVAIAALSVSPERDSVIDFSNVYYVGEAAALAQRDAPVQLATAQDLSKYRVGVQKGSLYESWMRATFVNPGLMAPQSLVTYPTPDEAVAALVSQYPPIDVVVIDSAPAEVAVRSAPVKIVAQGVNPQRYAIALPQGAIGLQAAINQALLDMQNDGTLAALAQQYLRFDPVQVLPTAPPPAPTATPAPAACLDGMAFVQDLNYPDNQMRNPPALPPGQPFQKGWRIQNTGTCTWNNTYALSYLGAMPQNAPVGGNPVAVQGQVGPGQTYDVYVSLTAPWQPGTYQSFWAMRTPSGQFFGDRVYAGFQVVAPASPTPPPKAPVIYSFTANPAVISQGQCVTLSWQFEGRDLVMSRLFRNEQVILKDMPLLGSFKDCPPGMGQVQYRLQVDSEFAGSAQAIQVVTINPPIDPTAPPPTEPPPPPPPPSINYFTAEPGQVDMGACITLAWSFGGDSLASATITRNGALVAADVPVTGQVPDCPPNPGQYTYRLSIASEFSGSTASEQYVTVLPPTKPALPTPLPEQPVPLPVLPTPLPEQPVPLPVLPTPQPEQPLTRPAPLPAP